MVLRTAGMLLLLMHPIAASATPQLEITTPADTGRTRGFCWRAGPAPGCQSFVTLELMYEVPVYSTKIPGTEGFGGGEPDFGSHLIGAVGPMVNISEHDAAGITAVISANRMSPSLEARYRRWASPVTALDLSAGVGQVEVWSDVGEESHVAGMTLSAAVMHRDLIGANIRVDWGRSGGRSPVGAFLGARVGSYLAPIGAAALLGLAVIALLSGGFD